MIDLKKRRVPYNLRHILAVIVSIVLLGGYAIQAPFVFAEEESAELEIEQVSGDEAEASADILPEESTVPETLVIEKVPETEIETSTGILQKESGSSELQIDSSGDDAEETILNPLSAAMPFSIIMSLASLLENGTSYEINYNLDGGTNNSGNPESYTEEDVFPIIILEPSRPKHSFTGWTSDELGLFVPTLSVSIPAGLDADVTLTANWEQTEFSVIFIANLAVVGFPKTVDVPVGQTVSPFADPVSDGYDFKGWFLDNWSFTSEWEFTDVVTEDITVYAKWEQKPFTSGDKKSIVIQFDGNGGAVQIENDGYWASIRYAEIVIRGPDTVYDDFNDLKGLAEAKLPGSVFMGWVVLLNDEPVSEDQWKGNINAFVNSNDIELLLKVRAKWGDAVIDFDFADLVVGNSTKVYDKDPTDSAASPAIDIDLLTWPAGVDPGHFDVFFEREPGENVGTYAINVEISVKDEFADLYNISESEITPGIFTITPRLLIISPTPAPAGGITTIYYGEDLDPSDVNLTIIGLLPVDDLDVLDFENFTIDGSTYFNLFFAPRGWFPAYPGSDAEPGYYGIIPRGIVNAEEENYRIVLLPGPLNVIKIPLEFGFEAFISKVYGTFDPDEDDFGEFITSEVNKELAKEWGDDIVEALGLSISVITREPGENVGDYQYELSFEYDDQYFDLTYEYSATLTILPAKLIVTPASYTLAYNAPIPAYALTVTGYVVNNELGINDNQANVINVMPVTSMVQPYYVGYGPGTLIINSLGGSFLSVNPNYVFEYRTGTLVVSGPPAVVPDPDPPAPVPGNPGGDDPVITFTPRVIANEEVVPEPEEPVAAPPVNVIEPTPTPESAPVIAAPSEPPIIIDFKTWAVLNLILTIVTGLIMIMLLVSYIFGKKEEKEENIEYEKEKIKKHLLARLITIATTIVAVVLFVLTQDMTLPMGFADFWTIWHIVILVATVVLAFLSIRKTNEQTAENLQ